MPVQKGQPAPSKLFVTKADQPQATAPAQVVAAPPAQQGMNLADITKFLQAIPPVVWERLLAPKPAAPAPATGPAPGMVYVDSGGTMPGGQGGRGPPPQVLPPPAPEEPTIGAAQLELLERIGRLGPEERKDLAKSLIDMVPDQVMMAKLRDIIPRMVAEEHAIMANLYMADNMPQTNPTKKE